MTPISKTPYIIIDEEIPEIIWAQIQTMATVEKMSERHFCITVNSLPSDLTSGTKIELFTLPKYKLVEPSEPKTTRHRLDVIPKQFRRKNY